MTLRGVTGLVVLCLSASLAFADAPRVSPFPKLRPAPPALSILRPKPRPMTLVAQPPVQKPAASAKGSVCGNPAIKGVALQAIRSRIKACTVSGPVSVTAVDGVQLVPAATINCDAAQALATWIDGLRKELSNQRTRRTESSFL